MSDDMAARNAHATNIGLIVLALASHEVGDWGDSRTTNTGRIKLTH